MLERFSQKNRSLQRGERCGQEGGRGEELHESGDPRSSDLRRSAGAAGTGPGSRAAAEAREGRSEGRGGLRETEVAVRVEQGECAKGDFRGGSLSWRIILTPKPQRCYLHPTRCFGREAERTNSVDFAQEPGYAVSPETH